MNHEVPDDARDEIDEAVPAPEEVEEPEAAEADVAEQWRPAVPTEEAAAPPEASPEVPEADFAEQHQTVPIDEDEY